MEFFVKLTSGGWDDFWKDIINDIFKNIEEKCIETATNKTYGWIVKVDSIDQLLSLSEFLEIVIISKNNRNNETGFSILEIYNDYRE